MRMFYTARNEFVEVCAIYQDRTAMIFDPYIASKTGPSGAWVIVKLSKLIPEDYVNREGKFESKTEKNKLKARLTLHNAEWEATDGSLFTNVEDGIEYERHLAGKERVANTSDITDYTEEA